MTSPPPTEPNRLRSLDALRGFDMFWIIGGDYLIRSLPKVHDSWLTQKLAAQMDHCEWAGFRFYDLIFPVFVFIVGAAIPLSLPRLLERAGRPAAIRRIVSRSVILFLLGVFYMGGVASGFKNMYFAGVLHRIAVAYFFAALLFCFCKPRTLVAICVGLLVSYWVLMTFVPVPGMGAPDLTQPGKNLAHYLDGLYLPGQKFEGTLLSTLAAVANCLLGIFAGLLLNWDSLRQEQKLLLLLTGGVSLLTLGFAWAQIFPVIKLLWTSSYVLVACGIGAVLLGLFYFLIEIRGWQRWAEPFVWIGTNAITIYLVSSIVNFHRLAGRFVGGDIARGLGRFDECIRSLVALGLAFLLVRFLHRRKIFLRL